METLSASLVLCDHYQSNYPSQNASNEELRVFILLSYCINCWQNSQVACDLWHLNAHVMTIGLCCLTFGSRYTSSNDVSNKCECWSYHVLSRLTDDFHTEAGWKMLCHGIVYSCGKIPEGDIRIELAMKTSSDVQYTKFVANVLGFVERLSRSFDSVVIVSNIRASTSHVETTIKNVS